ncbi:hypothetical protein Rsub_09530 [Raphidocelis subcapitata]|uniref:Alfin N-terminal domain-containing protein n=1 Tax=Raphidocelis subcapitata TaxID=307507 RepID=A0A2V0PIE0_9CHLO|nr:hypothetical protein Rsub_09530 [Raphidocelis subcapitata]|eukprot:GBF97057.1 hypothetical protein Rsub_09530 [Raphidocelis subcapitata]
MSGTGRAAQQPARPPRFPRTVDEIFDDFCRRRHALQTALTDDADALFDQCDPSRQNVCLYGDRSGAWVVGPPTSALPGDLPEPCLGINFARDGMGRKDWLALVACHSDAWLFSVAFFFAARLDAAGRAALFAALNRQPTLFEIAIGRAAPAPAPEQGRVVGVEEWERRRQQRQQGQAGGGGTTRRAEGSPGGSPGGSGGGSPGSGGGTGVGAPPAPLLPPLPFKQPPASASGAKQPEPSGRPMVDTDIGPTLQGRYTEIFWPDDALWRLAYVARVDAAAKTALVLHWPSAGAEQLDLEVLAREGQMRLLPDCGSGK